jgi:hypothetical protein
MSVCAIAAAQSANVNVSGTWILSVQSDAGASMPTLTLKQDGQKLSGHYSSMLVGEAEVTGSIKGQAIEFTVRAEVQGMPFELKYNATLEGKDSMKGTLSTELGGGTFTASRK